jgi:hypothetical protein
MASTLETITFSADRQLIEAARRRASDEHSTLNEQFRQWLEAYAGGEQRAPKAAAVIEDIEDRIRTGGRRYTRDEMNER